MIETMKAVIEKAKQIKCVICDIDGVLTNGLIYIDNQANELKAFHIQDGMGLKLLMSAGIEVAIITGSANAVIEHRMKQLDIKHYFKGQIRKQIAYQELKTRLGLTDEQFAYIGDDLPDLVVMKQVGLSIAVSNAVKQVKAVADWQTELPGGQGGVREACDLILEAQGMMHQALEHFLTT